MKFELFVTAPVQLRKQNGFSQNTSLKSLINVTEDKEIHVIKKLLWLISGWETISDQCTQVCQHDSEQLQFIIFILDQHGLLLH
jgi:hypothetical protein